MGESIDFTPKFPRKESEGPWSHDGEVIQSRIDPKTRDLEIAVQTQKGNIAVCYVLFIPSPDYTPSRTDSKTESDNEVTNFREVFKLGRKVHLERYDKNDPHTIFSLPEEGKPKTEWDAYEFPSKSVRGTSPGRRKD